MLATEKYRKSIPHFTAAFSFEITFLTRNKRVQYAVLLLELSAVNFA